MCYSIMEETKRKVRVEVSRKPEYQLSGEYVFSEVADYAIHYGDVAVIVTDREAQQRGYTTHLIHALEEMCVRYEVLVVDGEWSSVERVKEIWCEQDYVHTPNMIISVGRTPTIHFAKALSLIAPFVGHVHDLFTGKANVQLVLPHITIPVTEGKGIEIDISDLVNTKEGQQQLFFQHRELVPKVVAVYEATERQQTLAV